MTEETIIGWWQGWPFWLALTVMAVSIAAFVAKPSTSWLSHLPPRKRLHEHGGVNAVSWFAVFLAIPWGIAFLYVLYTVASYGLLPDLAGVPDADQPAKARAHFLTIGGLFTLTAALAAAPLALLRVHTVERQTKATEEGLVTDRINKAVEGLGAEKIVKRIVETLRYRTDENGKWMRDDNGDVLPALRPDGTPIVDRESVEETVPNIEVRIGAILALERIALLNLDEHIQIMEILCAYVRENAPAKDLPDLDDAPAWPAAEDSDVDQYDEAFDAWLKKVDLQRPVETPRADIQMALTVIGRRSDKQKHREWGDWRPFDLQADPHPEMQLDEQGDLTQATLEAMDAWEGRFATWDQTADAEPKPFRLDLRKTNLAGVDLTNADLNLVRLDGAQMQRAVLTSAKMQRADLYEAQMQRADLRRAQMQRADLTRAQMQRANLISAQMQRAVLTGAQMQRADLRDAKMQRAVLTRAQMQRANLTFAKMQRANLTRAQMQRAVLTRAQMQRADLYEAQMQRANLAFVKMQWAVLTGAQMQGANLISAQMQGADLRDAQISAETDFNEAEFLSASLKHCNWTQGKFATGQLDAAFGDATTQLPAGAADTAKWPAWDVPFGWKARDGSPNYDDEWEKWQREGRENYTPPPPESDTSSE